VVVGNVCVSGARIEAEGLTRGVLSFSTGSVPSRLMPDAASSERSGEGKSEPSFVARPTLSDQMRMPNAACRPPADASE
jgi:hypothetical protein